MFRNTFHSCFADAGIRVPPQVFVSTPTLTATLWAQNPALFSLEFGGQTVQSGSKAEATVRPPGQNITISLVSQDRTATQTYTLHAYSVAAATP